VGGARSFPAGGRLPSVPQRRATARTTFGRKPDAPARTAHQGCTPPDLLTAGAGCRRRGSGCTGTNNPPRLHTSSYAHFRCRMPAPVSPCACYTCLQGRLHVTPEAGSEDADRFPPAVGTVGVTRSHTLRTQAASHAPLNPVLQAWQALQATRPDAPAWVPVGGALRVLAKLAPPPEVAEPRVAGVCELAAASWPMQRCLGVSWVPAPGQRP
jgi:hypothetical protein